MGRGRKNGEEKKSKKPEQINRQIKPSKQLEHANITTYNEKKSPIPNETQAAKSEAIAKLILSIAKRNNLQQ